MELLNAQKIRLKYVSHFDFVIGGDAEDKSEISPWLLVGCCNILAGGGGGGGDDDDDDVDVVDDDDGGDDCCLRFFA